MALSSNSVENTSVHTLVETNESPLHYELVMYILPLIWLISDQTALNKTRNLVTSLTFGVFFSISIYPVKTFVILHYSSWGIYFSLN